jgi:RNA polymerase sigma-70 factor (ECF subfamily)
MTSLPPDPRGGARQQPDAALVGALRRGDEGAFESLVRTHGGRLLATARRMLRNEEDARDAVQETFLSAFRGLAGFGGGAQLSTWLHRILINACLMRLRTRRRKAEEPIEALLPRFLEDGHHAVHPPAWAETVDVLLQRREEREFVRAAIERLPASYQTVLLLRDVEELDTAETARAVGLSTAAVKVRLHRARQALRALLEPRYARGHA